ncbi:MAG: protein-L-isoaspartate O-methyltransferase [Flavobacteriales bacterium]|nr:MAG: protein-L-isoaspartate O-methyltransferase [Flavobacteriales bacterium]
MIDTFRHKGLRRKLVAELSEKGISDKNVLAAIEKVPRHYYMDNVFLPRFAYADQAFQIGAGQTISQPYTVAFQSSLLEIKKGDKVLEIGTGSGYQTAVLLELGAKVFSIERQKLLYENAKVLLNELNYKPKLFYGDGYLGLPTFAPFDKALVTAGAPYIPVPLKEQLKIGGVLVIPVGEGDSQTMVTVKKLSEKEYEQKEHGEFRFVPLLEDRAQNR